MLIKLSELNKQHINKSRDFFWGIFITYNYNYIHILNDIKYINTILMWHFGLIRFKHHRRVGFYLFINEIFFWKKRLRISVCREIERIISILENYVLLWHTGVRVWVVVNRLVKGNATDIQSSLLDRIVSGHCETRLTFSTANTLLWMPMSVDSLYLSMNI